MKKRFLIIGITIILIVIITGGVIAMQHWNQPLGVSLDLATRTPTIVEQTQFVESTADVEDAIIADQGAPTLTPEPTVQQPYCGGPPVMYILGMGVASRDLDYRYGLADVIRIARVDFVTPKITVLTLPRDLWVELPGIKEPYSETVTHGKLNQAYLYGGPGMDYYEGSGGGPGLLAHTIAHNYGLYVDHYGAVNMLAFERIINAVGGIDIYLDQDWDGRPVDEDTEDMGYFRAGQWTMTGEQALRFSRIRKKYSEVTRTDNQSLVLCALKEKVTRPGVLTSIPDLISAMIGMVQTDLTPAQIRQLTCLLPRLESGSLQFIRFPDEMMVQGRVYDPNLRDTTFVWDIPVEDIQAFIRDFSDDNILVDSSGGMSCP